MDILGRIAQLRAERGWSNYKLARVANLSENSLNNLFRLGNHPSISTLEAICKALGISLSEFFLEENSKMATLSEEEFRMLKIWRSLDDDRKEALLLLIKQQ